MWAISTADCRAGSAAPKLLKQAANDPAAYSGQFKGDPGRADLPEEKRAATLVESKHNAEINQRIMDAAEYAGQGCFQHHRMNGTKA